MSGLDERFHEYFAALDRSGQVDRCYLCRRTSADVKLFLGFSEDGVPARAAEYGIDRVIKEIDKNMKELEEDKPAIPPLEMQKPKELE